MVRKNLSELDDIRKYFSHKLSTPVFSVLGEQNQTSVHRQSDLDTQQLLQKSNLLVGEVNDIIKSKPIFKADVFSNTVAIGRHYQNIQSCFYRCK